MHKKQKKTVYIIGIGGKTTAPLAKMFKDMGWQVSGSDQGIYPPASEYLQAEDIPVRTPYAAKNLPDSVDLVVIGGSALVSGKDNPEYLLAQKKGFKTLSYPEVLAKYIVKPTSVVVVGSYAKGTIAALLSSILEEAGLMPSYMIGGFPTTFSDGIRRTQSAISVIEGDEFPTLNYSPLPKFMYYEPTHVVLTAAEWDHFNVYKTEEMYVHAYEELLTTLPPDGLLLACPEGKNVEQLLPLARCRTLTYGTDSRYDYSVRRVKFLPEHTQLTVVFQKEEIELTTKLFGWHNVQNLIGAIGMARELNVGIEAIQRAVAAFTNLKQRLELMGEFAKVTIIRDLAHSPAKAQATLEALRTRYKKNRVVCIFEAHATSLRNRQILNELDDVFKQADEVLLPKVSVFGRPVSKEWVTGKKLWQAIHKTHSRVKYLPSDEQFLDYLMSTLNADDVVIFMSSGGLRGLVERTITLLMEKEASFK